jgi:hypothetical protein
VAKWIAWGKGVDVDQIGRTHLRDFLGWVHEKAAADGGSNAGRTANKARENLRAIVSWAWEQDYLERLPRFSKPVPQRDVAGGALLTKNLTSLGSNTLRATTRCNRAASKPYASPDPLWNE